MSMNCKQCQWEYIYDYGFLSMWNFAKEVDCKERQEAVEREPGTRLGMKFPRQFLTGDQTCLSACTGKGQSN